jgi:hypothetical protein
MRSVCSNGFQNRYEPISDRGKNADAHANSYRSQNTLSIARPRVIRPIDRERKRKERSGEKTSHPYDI